MFPLWMNAMGDGGPLKPQPAKADVERAISAASKDASGTPRRNMCHSPDLRSGSQGRLSCDWLSGVKECGVEEVPQIAWLELRGCGHTQQQKNRLAAVFLKLVEVVSISESPQVAAMRRNSRVITST
jgi:hypothetical protein